MTVSAAKSATSSGRPRSGATKLSSTSTRDADTTLSRPRHGHAKGHGVVATASTAPGRSGVAHADHGVGHGHLSPTAPNAPAGPDLSPAARSLRRR